MLEEPLLLPSAVLNFPCTVHTPLHMQPLQFRQQQQQHQQHSSVGHHSTTTTTTTTSSASQRKDAPGIILEVRQLYIAPPVVASTAAAAATTAASTSEKQDAAASLYAFVRWKDTDHRQSGWHPLSSVSLKEPAAVLALLASLDPTAAPAGLGAVKAEGGAGPGAAPLPAAALVRRPLLSTIYREVTPGMARTLRAKKPLHFLEERLLRDDATPTTVRYFVYLNTYLFAPWYYAPYGILQPEYDPLLPLARSPAAAAAAAAHLQHQQEAHHPPTKKSSGGGRGEDITNPYLRDAHLCPFSLRLFSTPQQLRHELQHHRRGRLRPPGTEIYRDERRGLSVFEVNGSRYKTFCRHLFLLGKSFLENKLAGHDVHNYFFFVVCLHQRYFPHFVDDPQAMAVAGYFSWEKNSEHNLACIVTLPCFAGAARQPPPAHEGAGGLHERPPATSTPASSTSLAQTGRAPPVPLHLGRFMIALSYALSRQRGQVGGPERPLSDLGEAAYKRHWAAVLVRWMVAQARALQGQERPRGLKRPRLCAALEGGEGEGEEEDEDEDETLLLYEAADDGGVEVSTTVRDIARATRLEEPDVLKALLAMGVLHRNAEDRSTRLLLPPAYLEREAARLAGQRRSTAYAVFSPACWYQPCSRQVAGPGPTAAK